MNSDHHDFSALMRLPEEPYPGLRPFLDHESALMFGRDEQIAEVIKRLKQLPFVAVIGGSGSGKSSLIRAGVIPELRNFAIPKEGDFWIPIVCTPGTNTLVNEREIGSAGLTPITRLASKFAKQLKPCERGQDQAERLDQIARIIRQTGGFSRLIDSYSDELLIPPGPKAENARLLFVIDQFEELFHPSNSNIKDCDLLIERIIDHFFHPHQRCYVVLTMRSEHLNDCAAYLELPDAINKSFYLVRRLEKKQLQQAIVEPALLYLHLQQNVAGETEHFPESITFHQDVVNRVLSDVQRIVHKADHLPLLQHLLARIWQAARERSGPQQKVPACILQEDLARAVSANQPNIIDPLDPRINTLEASLENWAWAGYNKHDLAHQHQIDAVLRQLAFKDPNNGLYTQQRLNISECSRILGTENTRQHLHALVHDTFIHSINYLFWDDDDPQRPALKVSHESFIRGWSHFRRLIDEKAERFEEFLAVLRKCVTWSNNDRPDNLLLEPADLLRLQYANLEKVICEDESLKRWFGFLSQHREGDKLEKTQFLIRDFLSASKTKLERKAELDRKLKEAAHERDRLETDRKRRDEEQKRLEDERKRTEEQRALAQQRKYWIWAASMALIGMIVLYMLPQFLFSKYIQTPAAEVAGQLFEAESKIRQIKPDASNTKIDAAVASLVPLIEASEQIISSSKSKTATIDADWKSLTGLTTLILSNSGGSNHLRTVWLLMNGAARAEPTVNSALRKTLNGNFWKPGTTPKSEQVLPRVEKMANITKCAYKVPQGASQKNLDGDLYLQTIPDGSTTRGLFFVKGKQSMRPEETVILGATIDSKTKTCTSEKIIFAIPNDLHPAILFDSTLHYLIVATQRPDEDASPITLYMIDWERESTELGNAWKEITVVTEDTISAKNVRAAAGDGRVAALHTWPANGGITVKVADQFWRIFSERAQQLRESDKTEWRKLKPADDQKSPCAKLKNKLDQQVQGVTGLSKIVSTMFGETAGHCVLIKRGVPPEISSLTTPKQIVTPSVYVAPNLDTLEALSRANQIPPPIASFEFGRYETEADDWYLGVSGPHEGWLGLKRPSGFVGIPWSTHSLKKLGDELQSKLLQKTQ